MYACKDLLMRPSMKIVGEGYRKHENTMFDLKNANLEKWTSQICLEN